MKYVGRLIATGAPGQGATVEDCLAVCLYYDNCVVWNHRRDNRCEALSQFSGLEPDTGYTAGTRVSHKCMGRVYSGYQITSTTIFQGRKRKTSSGEFTLIRAWKTQW